MLGCFLHINQMKTKMISNLQFWHDGSVNCQGRQICPPLFFSPLTMMVGSAYGVAGACWESTLVFFVHIVSPKYLRLWRIDPCSSACQTECWHLMHSRQRRESHERWLPEPCFSPSPPEVTISQFPRLHNLSLNTHSAVPHCLHMGFILLFLPWAHVYYLTPPILLAPHWIICQSYFPDCLSLFRLPVFSVLGFFVSRK